MIPLNPFALMRLELEISVALSELYMLYTILVAASTQLGQYS